MKHLYLLVIFFLTAQIAEAQTSKFQYLSPKPNSVLNSKETNIIIRHGAKIDPSSLVSSILITEGSESGVHRGKLILSDDEETIVFNPSTPYLPNENVNVRLFSGIKSINGEDIGAVEFSFKISPLKEPIDAAVLLYPEADINSLPVLNKDFTAAEADSLPADFPFVTADSINNPYEGKIFIANKPAQSGLSYGYYVMIVDTGGTVLKYKKFNVAESNFKVLPNGLLAVSDAARHFVMDTSLAVLDTFRCGNGYRTDVHDFQLLPNGHAIVFGTDPQPVDMSLVVPGGRPDAVLTGNVIQELDADRNVIFQWRTWDYIPIASSYYDLTAKNIDYAHINTHEVDEDGNLIVTMRLMSNVIKIDRKTGDVLWILGGKDNQFTFLDEHESNAPTYFSHPHNAVILPNGNLTIFDNGDLHTPPYSRGVEYELDQENKTARLVWEYRHNPDIYASSGGNMQRLPNGNTIICWGRGGASNSMPVFTEVHPDGSIASELFYPNGMFSYRAYKFPMGDQISSPEVTAYDVLEGNTYEFNDAEDTTGISITFNSLVHEMYANAIVKKYNYSPMDPVFIEDAPLMAEVFFTIQGELITSYAGEVHVDLDYYPLIAKPGNTVVYVRSQFSEIFIAIPTSYDSAENELIFNTTDFGEFAFGVPQEITVNSPFPLLPKNNGIVNGESSVRLLWGTRGIVQSYNLQVASDTNFSNLIIDDQGLTLPSFTLNPVTIDASYFWRISTTNSAGTSGWSETFKFITASPFIEITSPNGGEGIYPDSSYIIRWISNVNDTLNILLVKTNQEIISIIADSIIAATNALKWVVSLDLQTDTTYKIIIESLNHAGLRDSSDNTFSVVGPTGVSVSKNLITSYILSQNYPNPFNPSTRIDYYIPKSSFVSLKIYDFLGNEIKTLVSEERKAGKYSAFWDGTNNRNEKVVSSVYFCSLDAGGNRITKKMILLK